jgi:TetR/AcrR family transcriptional regulator, fatty acid metabolism regulator protein
VPTPAAQSEKQRRILRAAITVFARNGYHGSKVGEVATEAGVAYGLVYHYFGSKEALLETIFRRTWRRMLAAVEELETAETTSRERIAGVARIVLGAWAADPELVSVLVREVGRGPQLQREVAEIQRAFTALERIIQRGQKDGELRDDLSPRLGAWILYGALEEILTGWVYGRLPDTPAEIEAAEAAVVAVLCDGFVVPGATD